MAKTFLEIFNKYKPTGDIAEILESATDIRIQADKENRKKEAEAFKVCEAKIEEHKLYMNETFFHKL